LCVRVLGRRPSVAVVVVLEAHSGAAAAIRRAAHTKAARESVARSSLLVKKAHQSAISFVRSFGRQQQQRSSSTPQQQVKGERAEHNPRPLEEPAAV
jgi:hypothetical protein